MTEARHLRHEWWQSQGFLAGAVLGPAPPAVLCHPTACTESKGQPQPRHWALDHRATWWQFLKDHKTYNITYAATDRCSSAPVPPYSRYMQVKSEKELLMAVLVSRVVHSVCPARPAAASMGRAGQGKGPEPACLTSGTASEHRTQHSVFTYMCWVEIIGEDLKWLHHTIWFPFAFQSTGSIYQ